MQTAYERRLAVVIGLARKEETRDLFLEQCQKLISDLCDHIASGADGKESSKFISATRGLLDYQEAWVRSEYERT